VLWKGKVSRYPVRKHRANKNLQGSEHVTWRNAVDTNACVRPLDGERRGHVTDSGLSGVVGSLRLRDVDNGTAHGSDHDNTARCLALHQMLSNTNSKEPGAVNVDAPELLHAVVRVIDCWEVLREPGRSYKIVDLSMLCDDLVERCSHRLGLGDVGVMCGDLRYVLCARVLPLELLNQGLGLLFTLVLCSMLLDLVPQPMCSEGVYSLFMSTIATSAPETTMAWDITRPRPLAPPVTTPTLSSSEKLASVRRLRPRPCTGLDEGSSLSSSGCSKRKESSVREALPSCPVSAVEAVVNLSWRASSLGSSGDTLSNLGATLLNARVAGFAKGAALKVVVRMARVACLTMLVRNIVVCVLRRR
jgi:hypothetical protein